MVLSLLIMDSTSLRRSALRRPERTRQTRNLSPRPVPKSVCSDREPPDPKAPRLEDDDRSVGEILLDGGEVGEE